MVNIPRKVMCKYTRLLPVTSSTNRIRERVSFGLGNEIEKDVLHPLTSVGQ